MKLLERFHRDMHTDDELVAGMEQRMRSSVLVEQASGVFLSFANMVIMGMVSGAALAGVGQVSTINNAVMYFLYYFAMGGTVMVSQYMGAKKQQEAKTALFNSLLFGIAFTAFLTVVMVVFRGEIIGFLFGAADKDVIDNSVAYFMYSTLATPFWFIYYQVGGILRGSGDSKTPMAISLLLNGLALFFNVLLVLVLGWGAIGSGLATFLSVMLAALAGFACLFRKHYDLNLRSLKGVRASLRHIKDIVSIGLPSATENLMTNGGKVVVSSFIASMGTAMISAYQVTMNVFNLITIPQNGYISMTVPIIGHLAGRREKTRTVKALRYLNRKVMWFNTFVFLLLEFGSMLLCLMYTRDWETLCIATALCMIYGPTFPVSPYYMNVPAGFKGVKEVNFCMIVSTVSMWISRVGLGYVFGVILGWQCYGVMIGMAIDSLTRSALIGKRFYGEKWLRHIDWKPET